jgi:hypothetical protein
LTIQNPKCSIRISKGSATLFPTALLTFKRMLYAVMHQNSHTQMDERSKKSMGKLWLRKKFP